MLISSLFCLQNISLQFSMLPLVPTWDFLFGIVTCNVSSKIDNYWLLYILRLFFRASEYQWTFTLENSAYRSFHDCLSLIPNAFLSFVRTSMTFLSMSSKEMVILSSDEKSCFEAKTLIALMWIKIILLTVCHTGLVMLVRRIWYWINF